MAEIFDNLLDGKLLELLKNGAVGVLPTDTVYGLVALASNIGSVQRLYDIKSREHKPGTVIAASIDQLVDLGIKARYLKAVADFWPNPISIVIPTGEELSYLHLGKQSLAIRIPKDKQLSQLLAQTGPLLTSSANQPGQPPANNLAEAQAYFGDQVDFYVDGGDLSAHQPSTLIRIIDDEVVVLREGAVKISTDGEVL